ncbi:TlpA family protein disulfide reductase [Nonlabens sp. Hel1_33_55]|uniref:TlpA family protein disulfide reductase n=1 Tax=Nonlabens sp. Hel1_33_55 TaxID=1336802 RepID=UPI0012FD109F|nr:TlpA disulfide reductase family protein [Nonlabens sp. Hel1_33_55]
MKKVILLFLAVAVMFGCKEKTMEQVGSTTGIVKISGIVEPADSLDISQIQVYAYDYLKSDYDEYNADLNADGSFQLEMELSDPREVTVFASRPFSVLAAPGDSIYVAISKAADSTQLIEPYFTGDRAATNNELQRYLRGFPVDVQAQYNNEADQAVEEFTAFAKAEQQSIIDYNKTFLSSIEDPILQDYINAREKFFFPNSKIDYAMYRDYYGLETPAADGEYFNFIDEIPEIEKSDLVNTTLIQRLVYTLKHHYQSKARLLVDDGDSIDKKALELAAARSDGSLLHDLVTHEFYLNQLQDHNVEIYESTNEQFLSKIEDEEIKNSITSRYEAEKKLLESPELPEEAELLEFESANAATYLDEIVDNANGKVVYIDNWATWCGPCKSEFKEASPKLHDKFNDDVEFVYLCHNSERRAYLPSIAEFKIKGKHYFLSDEESKIISQQIELEGFPTYTVINKSGEIVLSDYIHRPSYPATTELLTKLINE